MSPTQDFELLLENKAKTDQALAEYAEGLREQLRRLDGVIQPPQKTAKGQWHPIAIPSGMKSKIAAGLLLILFGMMIGYGAHSIPTGLPNKTSVVKPSSESLEEFVARESKTLSADERHKLADVTVKILEQHFSRPSELAEEFSLQRRLAGIDSPAFQTFSKKWAAKVEEKQPQTIEALQQVYQSLLDGLTKEELEVRSQELEEQQETSNQELLTPNSSLLTPPKKRQRLFRLRSASF